MASQLCVTATHIVSDVASLTLVLLAGSTLMVAATSLLASWVLHRRTLRHWRAVDGEAKRRVLRACRAADIRSRAVVFRHRSVIACSRGLFAPSIWVSSAAVDALDDDELVAVLAHEDHHCARRDPAKRQLLEVLARALFAFPVVAEATGAFRRAAEFAADDAAARVTSTRTTATALLRFAAAPDVALVVPFGSSATIGERVQRLIESRPPRREGRSRAQLISGAIVLAALACLLVVAALPTAM
jgi:beta-lactamase regulating signal transducer with metallopeptidase domain